MSIEHVHADNVAVSFEGRTALYIEGAYCAFTQIQVIIEDGVIPMLQISVPPTAAMRDIAKRARCHVLIKEIVNDEWVCFSECEILEDGFARQESGRDITFMAQHVTGLLDQYAITALDPASYALAEMKGSTTGEPTVATPVGNVLDLFTVESVVSELVEADPKTPFNATNLDLARFYIAAFRRYEKIIGASRIRDSYSARAVSFHRLYDRIVTPNGDAVDWSAFYTRLIGLILTQNIQAVGGKVTFFQLMQLMAQHFLYQVTVIPNAESYRKQLQVKPQTMFNAIPRCNVIYSSLAREYDYRENLAAKPTRMEAHFFPFGTQPGQNLGALARYFTVYAPTELQHAWNQINQALEAGGTTSSAQMTLDHGKLTMTPPTDGIPFMTREESRRGVIGRYYEIPQTLNAAIMSMVQKPPVGSTATTLAPVQPGSETSHAFASLSADNPEARVLKYRAFLCMALGDGRGIDPKRFNGVGASYHKRGDTLIIVPDMSHYASDPVLVPANIVYLGTRTHPVYSEGAIKSLRNVGAIQAIGANYVIDRDGRIIQALPRSSHLTCQPRCIPFGVQVQGLSASDALLLNKRIPPYGFSGSSFFQATRFSATALGSAPWPSELGPEPVSHFRDRVFFDPRYSAANGTIDNAQFQAIALNSDDVSVSIYNATGGGTAFTGDLKVLDKGRVATGTAGAYIYWLKLSKSVIARGANVAVGIRSHSAFSQGSLSFKPWVLMPTAPAGSSITPVSASTLNRIEAAIDAKRLTGGNANAVAIAFELPAIGVGLTAAQISSGAYLTAILKELTAGQVGTLKAPTRGRSERKVAIADKDIVQLKAYFTAGDFDNLSAYMGELATQTTRFQDAFYRDFQTWDTELQKGSFQPLGTAAVETSTPAPSALDTQDPSSSVQASGTQATASIAEQVEALSKDIDKTTLENYINHYAAAIVNFQFHNDRFAPQSFQLPGVFNPYVLVGYPALVLDSSDARYDLIAYMHAAVHVLTPNSADTHMTMTHVRRAKTEKLIPYRDPQLQYFNVSLGPEENGGKAFNLSAPKDDAAYKLLLKQKGYSTTSRIPVELLGLDEALRTQPPFIYEGGFGTDNQKPIPNANYSAYAAMAGYVDGAGVAEVADNSHHFVFGDDPEVFYASTSNYDPTLGFVEGQGTEGRLAAEHDIDLREALKRVYRKIQKVGQNNAALSQACLVAFDTETQTPEKPPDRIKVYTQLPTYGKDGKPTDKGTLMAFDTAIQTRIDDHSRKIAQHTALKG
jgi:hypothetical protein